MNPDTTKERQAGETTCGSPCKDAYDECVKSGVTADPCHDLFDRCKTACIKDEAG
jgi:hypothetical protein